MRLWVIEVWSEEKRRYEIVDLHDICISRSYARLYQKRLYAGCKTRIRQYVPK